MRKNIEDEVSQSIKILNEGGIILYPTDTIWGIGCDATNESAISKIFSLKKRPDKKSMIILVEDENKISDYVNHPDKKIFEYLSATENPTTVIYQKAKNLPGSLISDDGTIAIRIVKDNFCKKLISQFKKPIVSTSANISGQQFPKSFSDISDEIKNGVDYIVQHRQNDLMSSAPSAIIKLNDEGEIITLR